MRIANILTLLLLCNCASKRYPINDFHLYNVTPINKVKNDHKLDIKDGVERVNVVVGRFDQLNNANDQLNNFAALINAQLVQTLAKKKFINLIDRQLVTKIESEIQIAELRGDKIKNDSFIRTSDYAIVGTITRGDFASKYSTSLNIFPMLAQSLLLAHNNGINVVLGTPSEQGTYDYEANVEGIIRILMLPSLQELKRINFSGRATKREAGDADSAKSADQGLVQDAVSNAIASVEKEIFQHISPIGYITQRRDSSPNESTIFKVSFGSDDGVKPGDKIWLKYKVRELNDFTGREEVYFENQEIGVVSDMVMTNFTWIIVPDKDRANKLLLGEKVLVST